MPAEFLEFPYVVRLVGIAARVCYLCMAGRRPRQALHVRQRLLETDYAGVFPGIDADQRIELTLKLLPAQTGYGRKLADGDLRSEAYLPYGGVHSFHPVCGIIPTIGYL